MTVVGLSGVTAITAGDFHSCALTRDGTAHCWGSNASGQLGNGSATDSATPVTVVGLSGLTAISAGYDHSCAAAGTTTGYCWGDNTYGQLGNGTTTGSATPVTVVGLSGVTAITAGYYHSCAVTRDGRAHCWGDNAYGELGNGAAKSSSTPVTVVGLSGVIAVDAGYYDSCAVTGAERGYCWGLNIYGELGNASIVLSSATPVTVMGLSGVIAITAGYLNSCAVTRSGTGYCWGVNYSGELGNGTVSTTVSPVPGVVSVLAGVTAIATGASHSCALTAAHTVHCWGLNTSGQLGDGTTTNRTTAVATLGLTNRTWDRLGGSDRYATAAAVSRSAFPDGGAGAVVLARGDAYPDALVGVPLAADRYGTAAAVAAMFFPAPTTVGIATGLNFPDALAGAAQLATAGGPLLLTTTTVLPAVSGSVLTAVKASVGTVHFYGQIDVVADPVALAAAASLGY